MKSKAKPETRWARLKRILDWDGSKSDFEFLFGPIRTFRIQFVAVPTQTYSLSQAIKVSRNKSPKSKGKKKS